MTDTLELPAKVSLWLRDPAKMVFRIVSTVVAVAGALGVALTQYADLVPHKYKAQATMVLGVCTTIGVVGTKITTFLIGHGYGPKKNGKNGAWAPEAVKAAVEHAQSMSARKQDHSGTDLPGAQPAGPVETFGVVVSG